jgi:Na+/glutamate symporter
VEPILGLSLLNLVLEILQLAQSLFLGTLVRGVVLLLTIAFFSYRRVHTFTHDGLGDTALDILVGDTSLLLEFLEDGCFVDSIVSAQGEYEDVF